jgi:ubiquinone/menaquinone biosynthesis C-methylase UbiE
MPAPGSTDPTKYPGFMSRLLRLFFQHFYREFAWTYDVVAAVVSIGRWNRWILASVPFLVGHDILEIGFGPGHLQAYLLANTKLRIAGLDESRQMGMMASNRLKRQGLDPIKLVRGQAQALPFASRSFDTVVSTFPSEYIFEAPTVYDVHRILRVGGRFVVMPAASIVGKGLTDRAAAWLFRATHQAPASPREILTAQLERILREAGFEPEFETLEIRSSLVFLVNARRTSGEL